MKRIILPVAVMRFVDDEKLKELARLVLRKNDDVDVIHYEQFGRIIKEVRKED